MWGRFTQVGSIILVTPGHGREEGQKAIPRVSKPGG